MGSKAQTHQLHTPCYLPALSATLWKCCGVCDAVRCHGVSPRRRTCWFPQVKKGKGSQVSTCFPFLTFSNPRSSGSYLTSFRAHKLQIFALDPVQTPTQHHSFFTTTRTPQHNALWQHSAVAGFPPQPQVEQLLQLSLLQLLHINSTGALLFLLASCRFDR